MDWVIVEDWLVGYDDRTWRLAVMSALREYDRQHFAQCHGHHFHYIGDDGKVVTRMDMPSIVQPKAKCEHWCHWSPNRCDCKSCQMIAKEWDFCPQCGLPLAGKEETR